MFIAERPSAPGAFACQPCRSSKRRCDGAKPQCSTCSKASKLCTYVSEPKKRKRKYWDENYVKFLENQIQSLLAVQNKESSVRKAPSTTLEGSPVVEPQSNNITNKHSAFPTRHIREETEFSQSPTAMEELSVMMWRTNLADGVAIESEPTVTPVGIPQQIQAYSPNRAIPECGKDSTRVINLTSLFLQHINGEHQFTRYKTTASLSNFPDEQADLLFLHSAILAAGATFEHQADSLEVSNQFAELSESLVFTCFKNAPSIKVIQGLCILSWRSLALGYDHVGWVFLSMAAGLAVHLKLHVLVLDEIASQHLKPTLASAQAFWSFYMTDRTSISILGRNCILPWRRVNVPTIDAFFSEGEVSLTELSFAWQCKLWYMHDQNMDQIFSSSFEKSGISDQVALLISMHETLNEFMKSRDSRLDLGRGVTPKPVLLFHMAYQMTILITMPPFLRLFALAQTEEQVSHARPLVLQSITTAASSMIQLVQNYCKWYGFEYANPLLIHHLLSASIVHLMNTTSKIPTLRRHSTRSVRKCLTLLHELGRYWELRSQKSINAIRTLAKRWNVEDVLLPDENFDLSDLSDGNGDPLEHIPPFVGDIDPSPSNVGQIPRNSDVPQIPRLDQELDTSLPDGTEQQYDFSIMDLPATADDEFGLSPFFPIFGEVGDFFWNSSASYFGASTQSFNEENE
ncbi:hypothetical protein F1880_003350 [Penicillium rolfsii]|nr:hypothetical protein F1880_003350 [Penicillium rolfsii]